MNDIVGELRESSVALAKEMAGKYPTYGDYEIALDSALIEIREMLLAKHHDYGSSNLVRRGEFGIVVRIEDKLARIENLANKEFMVDNEGPQNSWKDVAGYAIQALLFLRGVIK
jgi:hypothetical protein